MPATRYFPIAAWLKTYQPSWLRFDIIAGLTCGAVVIPKAMAMATIAGLPVELGLYACLLPMAVYALLGTSPTLSMSTTATIGMLTGAALTEAVPAGSVEQKIAATATLTFMVGAALLLGSVLKLGTIANFISDPVLTGFKIGLGFVIIADQAPKLLGIHIEKAGFFRDIVSLVRHLPETHTSTLLLAGSTLLVVFLLETFWHAMPAPLVAVVGGIAASGMLELSKLGVATVGSMPAGLPGVHLPGTAMIQQLWPAAIGIALMSFTETIAVGRAFAKAGDPRPDADQELRALGLANLAASLFPSVPTGGGTSQTAVNCNAGARSQISELATVGVAVLACLFLAPLIGLMPQATLAAVVIATTAGLVNPKELVQIRRVRHMEFWCGVSAALGVIFLGTLQGILAAVVISMASLVYESNRAPVYSLLRKPGTNIFRPKSAEHPEDESIPGLLIVRPQGTMYFANAERVGDQMWRLVRETNPRVVAIDCTGIPDLEYTALRMLINGEEKLKAAGVELWIAGLTPAALLMVRRSALGDRLGHERMCFDVPQAVSRFQASAVRAASL